MDITILTRMAHDIEKNIPVHDETYLRISEHLVKFWTPKMRSDFYQYV
ncbi:MAG: formate dehydrogenase, partial [Actinobacteria bacterium]|nr:formate dehydrogenase [Actinomycetota bacterium]